jgi:hypothetical protein
VAVVEVAVVVVTVVVVLVVVAVVVVAVVVGAMKLCVSGNPGNPPQSQKLTVAVPRKTPSR